GVQPTATLTVPNGRYFDKLTNVNYSSFFRSPYGGQGTRFADVTGDGIVDVVAGACNAKIKGVAAVGAIYVWQGGPTLTGPSSPLARSTQTSVAPSTVARSTSGKAEVRSRARPHRTRR